MKVAIHQPNFLPYLGFFDKLDSCDTFVLYDSTQFVKGGFNNRNKIKTKKGDSWLTVSVLGKYKDSINLMKLAETDWKKRHFDLLKANYSKTSFYDKYIGKLQKIYSKDFSKLTDFNISLLEFILNELEINKKTVLSSELDIKTKATDALIEICEKVGGKEYFSGIGGKNYLEEDKFEDKGIKLSFQNYRHPTYKQQFEGFSPYMSIVDLLFNEGPKSLEIIRSGRK